MAASSNPLRRGSRGWGMFLHQNHGAGGGNGSIMVGMFVCLCLASKKPSERESFCSCTDLAVQLLTLFSTLLYVCWSQNHKFAERPPPRSANLCPDISLTYLFISPSTSRHGKEPRRRHIARHRRTPPPHAVPRRRCGQLCRRQRWDRGCNAWRSTSHIYLILHMCLRPLIFCCLQIFRRSCQAGQFFWGRSLTVSLILSKIFSLYQQLRGRVWLRHIRQGIPTRGAQWMDSRGSSRSST